jgi:hypothetical protein
MTINIVARVRVRWQGVVHGERPWIASCRNVRSHSRQHYLSLRGHCRIASISATGTHRRPSTSSDHRCITSFCVHGQLSAFACMCVCTLQLCQPLSHSRLLLKTDWPRPTHEKLSAGAVCKVARSCSEKAVGRSCRSFDTFRAAPFLQSFAFEWIIALLGTGRTASPLELHCSLLLRDFARPSYSWRSALEDGHLAIRSCGVVRGLCFMAATFLPWTQMVMQL